MNPSTLDDAVEALRTSLVALELPPPDVLVSSATGAPGWLQDLEDQREDRLADLGPTPDAWADRVLTRGTLAGLQLWALEDRAVEPRQDAGEPAWVPGFGLWLARRMGAWLCVHTSAGSATLRDEAAFSASSFAVLTDHVDVSGRTPLLGLGESRLGPLFPDQSRVHHAELGRDALRQAAELGLDARGAVAACLAGPALETPAERRMLARLGTDVAVQGLAPTLIASAHAGLPCVALVAVAVGAEETSTELAELVARAQEQAPRLDAWVRALLPCIAERRASLLEESAS